MMDNRGIEAGTAIVIVVILGLLFVSAFVDLVTCPACGGHGKREVIGVPIPYTSCPTCGGDGKITVLQYIIHIIQGIT